MIVRPRDVYGEPLLETSTIGLERQGIGATASRRQLAVDVPPGGRASFETEAGETYYLTARAEGYAATGRMIPGHLEELELAIPINPDAVTGFEWPEEPGPFPGLAFEDLEDDVQRAALLNIWAKLWRTPVGLAPAASFINEILEVREDRLIARMTTTASEALEDAENLGRAPSLLHRPPEGYSGGRSYKSKDPAGNLQISLFHRDDHGLVGHERQGTSYDPGAAGHELVGRRSKPPTLADIDIDEARGFAHLLDVISHHATGRKTNAIEIQQILLGHQDIDPGWRALI